jgi:hypothetical protein
MLQHMNPDPRAKLFDDGFLPGAFHNLVHGKILAARILPMQKSGRNPDLVRHFHLHPPARRRHWTLAL